MANDHCVSRRRGPPRLFHLPKWTPGREKVQRRAFEHAHAKGMLQCKRELVSLFNATFAALNRIRQFCTSSVHAQIPASADFFLYSDFFSFCMHKTSI